MVYTCITRSGQMLAMKWHGNLPHVLESSPQLYWHPSHSTLHLSIDQFALLLTFFAVNNRISEGISQSAGSSIGFSMLSLKKWWMQMVSFVVQVMFRVHKPWGFGPYFPNNLNIFYLPILEPQERDSQ